MEDNFNNQQIDRTPSSPLSPIAVEKKKLFKSRTNYFIDGVCGGLGEYSGVDPFIYRVVFSITSLLGGIGVLGYLFFGIVIKTNAGKDTLTVKQNSIHRGNIGIAFTGSFMIVLGVYFIVRQFSHLLLLRIFVLPEELFLPVFIIGSGIFLLTHKNDFSIAIKDTVRVKLTRSSQEQRLLGVCQGFAIYLNVDVTIVRLCWLFFSFATLGLGIILYFIISVFIPVQERIIIEE
ncbi:MAG: PspC domain-containing protein [bacterium]